MQRDLETLLLEVPHSLGLNGIQVKYSDIKDIDLAKKGIYLKGHSSVTETSAKVLNEYRSLRRLYKVSSKFMAMPYALVYGGADLDENVHGYLMQLVSGKNFIEYFTGISEALTHNLPKMAGKLYFQEAEKIKNGLIKVKNQLTEVKSDLKRANVEHGDLHYENFFINDENEILIIDPLPLTKRKDSKKFRKEYDMDCISGHIKDIDKLIEKIDSATRLRKLVGTSFVNST